MTPLNLIGIIGGIGGILGGIAALGAWLHPAQKRRRAERAANERRQQDMQDLVLGRDSRPGFDRMPSLPERLEDITTRLDARLAKQDVILGGLQEEWKPNGVRASVRLKRIEDALSAKGIPLPV